MTTLTQSDLASAGERTTPPAPLKPVRLAVAGLERTGIVHAAITYELERYDFPAGGGVTRHEQVSYLVGTVGLMLGRRH